MGNSSNHMGLRVSHTQTCSVKYGNNEGDLCNLEPGVRVCPSMGNSLSVEPRAPMNQFLNVWIARSAVLTLWLCGSTN